jgi:hypothetical protein
MLCLPLVRCDQPHMKPRDLPYKDDRLREHPRIARFREDINALATHIGPRNVFHWNQLQASGTFIERRFAGLGYSPSRQTYTVQGQSFFNVEPKLEGTKHPDEVIVVGAHMTRMGRRREPTITPQALQRFWSWPRCCGQGLSHGASASSRSRMRESPLRAV